MIDKTDIWTILAAVNEEMRSALEAHGGKTIAERVKEANSRGKRRVA